MGTAARDGEMPSVHFDGGTEAERTELLKLFTDFWKANDVFDSPVLSSTWDPNPNRVFFNSNGHTYHGLEDWLKIWDYYRPRFSSVTPAVLDDTRLVIRDGMAFITDDGVSRTWEWTGEGEAPALLSNPVVRATMVFLKSDDGWKVAHVHFSSRAAGLRPDQSE